MKSIIVVTQQSDFNSLVKQLNEEPTIAVDLESDSLHSYREKICLLQISTTKYTAVIDTLKIQNLWAIKSVFSNPAIQKIFHASDYDLRSLNRDYNFEVYGLFDTMLAAQFIGEERIGLADLLGKYFGVNLDKKFQKADWSQRPLRKDMIQYAAADTSYLHSLKGLLTDALEQLNRLSWLKEECQLLEKVRFEGKEGPLWKRFKGTSTLSRRQLAVLEVLLNWREQYGARLDRPVFKILGNKPLLEIARHMPQTRSELLSIAGLAPSIVDRHGPALLRGVVQGREMMEQNLPNVPKPQRREKDPQKERRLKILKNWRQNTSIAYGLQPGVLINNSVLESIAQKNPNSLSGLEGIPGIRNWQISELGHHILEVLKSV